MTQLQHYLRDVYTCRACSPECGFSLSANGAYYKFPPIIGANTQVDLLFVGINPRKSSTNSDLHTALMSSKKAFAELASNRWNGKPYIRSVGEPHYRFHLRVVEGVYGSDSPFETFAAVTELFFCATGKSNQLQYPGSSCADQFLPRTLDLIQPKVILAVGGRVLRYFNGSKHAVTRTQVGEREFPIVWMPHPGDPVLSEDEKEILLQKTILTVRSQLGKTV